MLAELGPAQFSLFLNFLNLSVKIQKDLKGHKKNTNGLKQYKYESKPSISGFGGIQVP